MIRRIIAIVLIVLGLGTIGAAIASATVWKPDSTVTVPLPSQPDVNYVISDPGVLNIVNPTVKVHAVAQDPESPVFLAMGRTDDVEAWVAESDHGKIVGLETWDVLSYETVDAVEPEVDEGEEAEEEEEEAEPANPADSDMWVEEVNGVGELSYTWEEIPGHWSMIVATDGSEPAPMVELTWEREVPTPALVPGIILGALLTIAGIVLLVIALRARERAAPSDADEPDSAELDATDLGGPVESSTEEKPQELQPADSEEYEASPEEIMAGVEAAASAPDPIVDTGEMDYALTAPADVENTYPHDLGEGEPSEESRPLTRREIRERERERERALALGTTDVGETSEHWPTQETSEPAAPPKAEPAPRRRWWQRKTTSEPVPARGPIVIDDDTGEIVITGEIDVSSLTPQASAASWRATWGLDKETQTRWIPVLKDADGDEGDDDE